MREGLPRVRAGRVDKPGRRRSGCPMCSMCTRIWCVRPVSNRHATHDSRTVPSCAVATTAKRVRAASHSSHGSLGSAEDCGDRVRSAPRTIPVGCRHAEHDGPVLAHHRPFLQLPDAGAPAPRASWPRPSAPMYRHPAGARCPRAERRELRRVREQPLSKVPLQWPVADGLRVRRLVHHEDVAVLVTIASGMARRIGLCIGRRLGLDLDQVAEDSSWAGAPWRHSRSPQRSAPTVRRLRETSGISSASALSSRRRRDRHRR